ncbi:hypothetical protein T01_8565 [Trichinella spiralis]|uniref:Uncharacterized protein n=1 Tax=Trichinella spiralis TaxID=6334 RepID=A0A0V1BE44_TRISP|nr:hypothetical protein T01_8565 [Trichinella spiralis]
MLHSLKIMHPGSISLWLQMCNVPIDGMRKVQRPFFPKLLVNFH